MDITYFIAFLISLSFGLYFSIFSYYCVKTERIKKVFMLFLLIGLSFLIISIFHFLWAFEMLTYSVTDFSLISSILLFFRVVILLVILSYIFHNNNILSFIGVYFLLFVSFLFGTSISFVVLVISFLIILLISLILYSKKEFERVGILGIFYSLMSFILFIIFYYGYGNVIYTTIALDVLFFLFLFEFVSVIQNNTSIIIKTGYFRKGNSVIFDFIKYFIFIFILINFIFISTVVIHELGHFASGQFFDCSYSRIVYESGLPHTELLCGSDDDFNHSMTIIFGILFPILVSFFFFLSGGQFIKELGVLVIGFNLLISYRDFLDLGFTDVFSLFISIVGFMAVIFAVGFLISSRAQEQQFIDFTEGHKSFNKKVFKK
jgi:hypothetical protein